MHHKSHHPMWLILFVFGIAVGSPFSLHAQPAKIGEDFQKHLLPYLQEHCYRCHDQKTRKGDFRLDNLSQDFVAGPSIEYWGEVIDKISSDEMPPPSVKNRPTAKQSARFVEILTARIKEGEAIRLAQREPVSFHRLTREEFANTISDLLAVTVDINDPGNLIDDDQWQGFKRIGSVLSLSAAHIEKYMNAAEAILDEAYPKGVSQTIDVRNLPVDLVGGSQVYGKSNLERLRDSDRYKDLRVDLWPGQRLRTGPASRRIESPGIYRVRIQVSGVKSRDGRAPHLVVRANNIDRILFEKDITDAEDQPTVIEFSTHLPAGDHQFSVINEVSAPLILSRIGKNQRRTFLKLDQDNIPWQIQLLDDDGQLLYPCLLIDWVEWKGPIITTSTQKKRDQFMPADGRFQEEVRPKLTRFAELAFRRPLRPKEIDKYLQLVQREMKSGSDRIAAIKTGMLAILCSKDFLYLVEGDTNRKSDLLNDWELASRLSYFLWSTMPDEELFQLARNQTLSQPDVLRKQVARMIVDKRSGRFSSSFSRQWLQLDRVGMFQPDAELYPEYDPYLERSMVQESVAFFDQVLKSNLTIREFLFSDWTMLNPRLAKHYGISGIEKDSFQRVELKPEFRRGGLLTQASVLSLTSDGARHRPVHRGVWISETILGRSIPEPPVNVEPIEPNPVDAAKSTIRDKLLAHQRNPNCAACHRKIDPLGLAFEHYDAIGRWRDRENVPTGIGADPKINSSGTLPDGRSFSGAREFQKLLLADLDQFHIALVEKMAMFAVRRAMTVNDREDLTTIAARSKANDCRLRELIESIVLSELFRRR